MEKTNEKIKIIALTGQAGVDLEMAQDFLTMGRKVFRLKRKMAGGGTLPVNEFLEKMEKGTIVEASCNEDNFLVWATDISELSPENIYIGIYTPDQISMLRDSSLIELLPLVISMAIKPRLDYTLEDCKEENFIRTLEKFIFEEKHYDIDEYFDDGFMVRYYKDHDELYNECKFHILEHKIKEFNKINNCITDLDNFI